MIKEGVIKKPENITINRKIIAYNNRINNYSPDLETLKDNYSVVHEDDNAIIWNRNA